LHTAYSVVLCGEKITENPRYQKPHTWEHLCIRTGGHGRRDICERSYTTYNKSVCPLVRIGSVYHHSRKRVSPPRNQRGPHSPAVEGMGGSNSVDWRESLALCCENMYESLVTVSRNGPNVVFEARRHYSTILYCYIAMMYIYVYVIILLVIISDTSENNGLRKQLPFHRPALIISKLQN
jgi:hypothetical protein